MPTLPLYIVIVSEPLLTRKEILPSEKGALSTVSWKFGLAPNEKTLQPDRPPKPIAAVGELQPASPISTSMPLPLTARRAAGAFVPVPMPTLPPPDCRTKLRQALLGLRAPR